MLSKSKSEENEECSIFKDSIVINDRLSNSNGLKDSISPKVNGTESENVNFNLRNYLGTTNDELYPSSTNRFEGRIIRSMSVTDINQKKPRTISEFEKYFSRKNTEVPISFSPIDSLTISPGDTEKEIKFKEINCNLKDDKNELSSTERKEGAVFNQSLYSQNSPFDHNQNEYFTTGNDCKIKTPPFLKDFLTESASSSTYFPKESQMDFSTFENRHNLEQSAFQTYEKGFLQTNSLFKNRCLESFIYGGGSKKRSFSEADLVKNNSFKTNIDSKFISEDYYISLYKKGKLSRSASDSCIDPRTFYKNENPIRTTVNKENLPKPTHSYAQIITRAISNSSEGKLSLGEIYKWIEDNFEYYKYANPVWKNSIRHNLSLSKCFKKVPREPGSRGKGGKWMLDKEFIYLEETKKKRRQFGEENVLFGNVIEEDRGKALLLGSHQSDGISTTEYLPVHNNSKQEDCK